MPQRALPQAHGAGHGAPAVGLHVGLGGHGGRLAAGLQAAAAAHAGRRWLEGAAGVQCVASGRGLTSVQTLWLVL